MQEVIIPKTKRFSNELLFWAVYVKFVLAIHINMKKLLFWLLPAVAWFGCKTPQKAAYTPDQIVPTENSVLWKITGNGLKKPSYLLGTIHLIPKADFELTEATRKALDNSQRVTFEIDMKDMTNISAQMSLMMKAFMPNGTTLKTLLPEADYAFVQSKLKEKGLPGGMLERMKPMFVSMMFADGGEEGGTMNEKMTSVEMEIYRIAQRRKLESAGLETIAYQMAIFDSIPYEAQAKMLLQSLRDADAAVADDKTEGPGELEKMLEMYRKQDITAMQSMISTDDSGMSAYEDILLGKRNRNWISVMGRMMREKPTLFAVGAGHLGGKGGVIALLRTAGYRVDAAQ